MAKQTKAVADGRSSMFINKDVILEQITLKRRKINGIWKAIIESADVCVDSIVTRKHIWDALQDKVNFYCDGRMSAEVLRVITACDENSRQHYPQTLFTAQQAHTGPCTAKTTIYCANIAAGFMLAQFTKYLRLLPVDPDIQINLLASEINVDSC